MKKINFSTDCTGIGAPEQALRELNITQTDITSDNRMFFQANADVVYCMNWSDPLWTLNGTTYTTYVAGLIGFLVTPISWTLAQNETVTWWTSSAQGRLRYKNGNRMVISVGTWTFVQWEIITGGTTWATATITTIYPFAPAFSAIFNSCMRVSGRTLVPNLVFKSAADNYTEFTFIWKGDILQFSETITWLSSSSQALFYITPNTLSVTAQNDIQTLADWTVSYITRQIQTTEGSTNNNCAIEVWSDIYYLSSSNSIDKILAWQSAYWFETAELSNRKYSGITNIMSTLSKDQSSAFGYYLPWEIIIKRFLKTEGSSFNDICIIYDITRDKFLIDNQKYFYWGVYMPTRWKNYTISMIEPKVFRDEYAQDDEDSPIPFEYRTKEYYFTDPLYKKCLRWSHTLLAMNELAEPTQFIYIDWIQRDYKTLGMWNITLPEWGIGIESIWDFPIGDWGSDDWWDDDYIETEIERTKWDLNKKWKKIQRRFTNETVGWKLKLKNITANIEVINELAINLTR